MDPKGDRLRKIQSGQLKLPDSVLKSTSIVLTTEKARGGGGCLEGGPRPRATKLEDGVGAAQTRTPIIIATRNNSMTLSAAEIPLPSPSPDKPLPSHADIPLPDAGDIPLPSADMGNIPLPSDPMGPRHDDIPLPSNDSIPLPADKPASQRRIKVSLSHLEPRGDELLCRSCVMTFAKQIEYDIHLQSDAHQQAIKSDLPDGIGTGASLLNKRPDKSPSHDGKSGHVSFSFKKHGPRITITQPFVRREEKRASPVEIKLLKPEMEKDATAAADEVVDGQKVVTDNGDKIDSENDTEISEKENGKSEKDGLSVPENRLLMSDFVKVQSKDDSGRVLDWPKEMIQYTVAEPKLMFSCNPLSFDFSQLFAIKKQPKAENNVTDDSVKGKVVGVPGQEVSEEKMDDIQKMESEEKKKSRKKKKKKKHKKHKTNKEVKEGEEAADTGKPEEEATTNKKKKKKHKRKHDEKEADTTKESVELNSENADEKDKEKKSKKKKKKSKQSDAEGEKVEDDDKKHKKRKKKKSKKKKKKHHGESDKEEKSDAEKEKVDSGDSEKESDGEKKEKENKKKKKKRKKHKRKEGDDNESSESESEKVEPVQTEAVLNTAPIAAVSNASLKKRKFPEGDSDGESEKIVAKLQALSRTKIVAKQTPVNNLALQKRIKKEPVENIERKTPSERKRVTSESSVNESTPIKKVKVTPKASGVKDNIPISLMQLPVHNVKVEKEESWSKIETQTTDNVKSKWDTSDSDMDNALNETLKKEKVLRKRTVAKTVVSGSKAGILKDLKSPGSKSVTKIEHEQKKVVTQSSSQRSNKSNVSAGSAKLLNSVSEKNHPRKSRKVSVSPASSHSRSRTRSRGRRRSYSNSESSSRSRSRSYSSSSDYSDDSRHSRHRRRRSSSRSYSRSSSRSHSRSYHRRRGRSSSSEYSRSRSYSSSRSRTRSHRRSKRSYTRSRSRSYSSSSSSYSSRSRNRSYRKSRPKKRRHRHRVVSRRTLSKSSIEKPITKKKEEKEVKEKVKEEKEKVDPSDIPLPDLSGKKDDERSEEKLKKLKEKTRRGDVGETVAKLVESLPAGDIPLPFSEGVTKTVSSDSLPSGPPSEALKENDTGFIGPKMPAPPPPPPMGRGFPPNHGPPGPPRPGWGGQWDHWDAHGPWDGMGPWDGPGPRQPFRGMRPPYDPRMYGPYDPRRRGPPPYMNRPRGPHPFMGPRYPGPGGPGGPHGPHPDYMEYGGYDYGGEYEHTNTATEEEPAKNTSSTPPPLPKEPPKESSPKPPLPKKKVKELEPEQNPDIVIPPEQAEQYKHLQKQAQKHARRQLRRQAKRDLGEPDEDSTSSESEPEEQVTPEVVEEVAVVEETPTAQLVVPQQVVLQPQPTGSPSGAYIIVSGGQQYIVQKPQFVQAGTHIQAAAAGQPVMVSQGAILSAAHAAASGAQPAHIVQQVPAALSGHPMIAAPTHITAGGVPVAMASAASIQHMQQVQQIQQMQQIQQIQQIQQAQAIQAHNQAVAAAAAAQHGSIVLGGRILVPTLGVRPGL